MLTPALTPTSFPIVQSAMQVASLTRKALVGVILALATCGAVLGQESTPTPVPTPIPSAEEIRLSEQNRILELEKTNAELKKDIREAQPKPEATPLEGKTSVDENVVIETQLVTYQAMSDVADRIGAEIHQKFSSARTIAIYDADELQNLKSYRAAYPVLEGRIEGLKQQYQTVLGELRTARLSRQPVRLSLEVLTNAMAIQPSNNAAAPAAASDSSPGIASAAATLPGTISPVVTGLKAFADLLALMRTDIDIKGKSVTVEERAMVAETFRAIRNRFGGSVSLYYPQVVSPEIYLEGCQRNQQPTFCSQTLSSLAELYAQREEAEGELIRDLFDVTVQFDKTTREKAQAEETITSVAKQVAELKLKQLNAELEKPWTPAQLARFQKYLKELETMKTEALSAKTTAESNLEYYGKEKNVLEQLQALNRQASELVSTLTAPDEKTGKTMLVDFLRAENMDKAVGKDGYWLEFKSISAGGNNRTRKNLFRYFSGAKLDHSGGIIVEWTLYDRNGASVDSNKDSSYGGYQTPKGIQSAKFRDKVADPVSATPQAPAIAKSAKH